MSTMAERASDLFDDEHQELEKHDLRAGAISRQRREDDRTYTTGLENVDESTKRLRPNKFCVLGAREGQGKTSIALRCALHNAQEGHRVLFMSLDMPRVEVQDRLLAQMMQVNDEHIRILEKQNSPHFARTLDDLLQRDLMVERPRSGQKNIQQITTLAEKVGAAILMIDYTRLIDGWDYGKPAAKIVDYLADWTQENAQGISTILLTQLKDDAVNKRPHNGFLQDTTQLAQRADRITLLYRPFKGRGPSKDTVAEIITSKNRWGPELTNHAGWVGETMDLYPMTAEEEAHARCCYRPPTK